MTESKKQKDMPRRWQLMPDRRNPIHSIFRDDDFDLMKYTAAAGKHVKGLNGFLKNEGDFTYWTQKEGIDENGDLRAIYSLAKNPFTGLTARLDTPCNRKQHLALLRPALYFPGFDGAIEEYPCDGVDGIAIRLPDGIACIGIAALARTVEDYADADRRAMTFIKRIDAYAERALQDQEGSIKIFVRADWKKILRRLSLYRLPEKGLFYGLYLCDRPAVTVSGMMLNDGDLSKDRTDEIIDALTEDAERKENV